MSPDEMILPAFCLLFGILFVICLTAALGWKQEAKEMRDSRDFYKDMCDRQKGMHWDSLAEAEKWFGKYIALLKGEQMSTDPCLDAALRAVRPSIMRRAWNWYKRVTGYEKAMLQRNTGLKIRSTYRPEFPAASPPTFPKKDFLKGII